MDNFTVTERPDIGIATIMARKNVTLGSIGSALGIFPPAGPTRRSHDGTALLGTGPGAWLALREQPETHWASKLATTLADLASVSDQSGGYSVLRITGHQARHIMQRGAFIDLHPDVFKAGDVATTVISHVGVTLWQLDDAPTFEVATFRSYAFSFKRWLTAAAAAL